MSKLFNQITQSHIPEDWTSFCPLVLRSKYPAIKVSPSNLPSGVGGCSFLQVMLKRDQGSKTLSLNKLCSHVMFAH